MRAGAASRLPCMRRGVARLQPRRLPAELVSVSYAAPKCLKGILGTPRHSAIDCLARRSRQGSFPTARDYRVWEVGGDLAVIRACRCGFRADGPKSRLNGNGVKKLGMVRPVSSAG